MRQQKLNLEGQLEDAFAKIKRLNDELSAEKHTLAEMEDKAEKRVDGLVRANVLLENDVASLNTELAAVKMQTDEKARDLLDTVKAAQEQTGETQ